MKNANNFASRSVSLSGVTEVELAEFNPNRNYLLIFNRGTNNCDIAFDGDFITIPAGQGLPFIHATPMNRFVGKCAEGETATVVVWEA